MVPQLYCRQAKGYDDPIALGFRFIKFVNKVEVVALHSGIALLVAVDVTYLRLSSFVAAI